MLEFFAISRKSFVIAGAMVQIAPTDIRTFRFRIRLLMHMECRFLLHRRYWTTFYLTLCFCISLAAFEIGSPISAFHRYGYGESGLTYYSLTTSHTHLPTLYTTFITAAAPVHELCGCITYTLSTLYMSVTVFPLFFFLELVINQIIKIMNQILKRTQIFLILSIHIIP